jgi:hypothetical protein
MGFLIQHAVGEGVPWSSIGPLLCSRSVARDLRGQVLASGASRWWWATDYGAFSGFAILDRWDSHWSLSYAWVMPAKRNRGLYGLFYQSRISYAYSVKLLPIRTLVHLSRVAGYGAQWKVKSTRGSWVTLEMQP